MCVFLKCQSLQRIGAVVTNLARASSFSLSCLFMDSSASRLTFSSSSACSRFNLCCCSLMSFCCCSSNCCRRRASVSERMRSSISEILIGEPPSADLPYRMNSALDKFTYHRSPHKQQCFADIFIISTAVNNCILLLAVGSSCLFHSTLHSKCHQ